MSAETSVQQLQEEVESLRRQLKHSEQLLERHSPPRPTIASSIPDHHALHSLLLISDSALPLGSFAYSSGLESYVAHHRPLPPKQTPLSSFRRFLSLSIASLASTTLPYLLHAHRHPDKLADLDDDFDASTLCAVARRASLAQGLALLNVWERSFRPSFTALGSEREDEAGATSFEKRALAHHSLAAFSSALKKATLGVQRSGRAHGHLAPIWGVFSIAMDIHIEQSAYVFMFNHAKAVLSAAVRASIMGPYQAQAFLASKDLRILITQRMQEQWNTAPEDAGQAIPVMDLWVGRHELLYSRIFNS